MPSITKMNLLLAIACFISIILYIVLPVIGASFFPAGLNGEICMQVTGVFVIPLILMALTLVISLLPIGPFNSIGGIVAAFIIMIIGITGKDALVNKLEQILSLGVEVVGEKFGAGIVNLYKQLQSMGVTAGVGMLVSFVLKMSWGITIPIALMFLTSIIGLVITLLDTANQGYPGVSKPFAVNPQNNQPRSHPTGGRSHSAGVRGQQPAKHVRTSYKR